MGIIKSRVAFDVDEGIIQLVAKFSLGRELTDKELKRLLSVFTEHKLFIGGIKGALIVAVNAAANNKNNKWEKFDKEHEDKIIYEWWLD